jgi:hypothetical protein
MNTFNAIKAVENKITEYVAELSKINDDKDVCNRKAVTLNAKLSVENAEYQAAVRVFNQEKAMMEAYKVRMEASKAIMDAANIKKTNTFKLSQSNSDEYNKLIRKYDYVQGERKKKEIDLSVMRESLELEQKIYASRKEEKQIAKKGKKNEDSDSLLKKIQKMPQDVMLLIRDYLPYDVRVSLIKDRFNIVMNKCKGGKKAPQNYECMGANAPRLFVWLLDYAATCPEFLPLLTREEARLQIPTLTPMGSEWKVYTYCEPKRTYTSDPIDTVVKNKINWLVELAQENNPKFAYKVMKTTIVLCSNLRKNKCSYTVNPKRTLTVEDLPLNYR